MMNDETRAALVDGRYNSDFHKGLVSAIARGLEASRNSGFGDSGTVNRIANTVTHYLLTTRREPAADAVDVFDAADSDSWPPPEMKDAPLIRYLHKVMKYHQPTITPQECWVAIGAVRMWMLRHPDRDRLGLLTSRPEPAADAIERAAKAMFTLEKDASGALVQWDDLLDNYGRNGVAGKAVYRDLARAALEAAAPVSSDLDARKEAAS